MKTLLSLSIIALAPMAGAAPDYTLHEWGTFTSVHGSDGTVLSGLQREEEHLPYFVYSHMGMGSIANRPGSSRKGFGAFRPLKNVTIKMETPVIYFYSQEPFKARVDVGFEGGSISQWYPQRTRGETPPKVVFNSVEDRKAGAPQFKHKGDIDFGKKYQGSIGWDVDVLAPDADVSVFKPGETLSWLRPRQTQANLLKVGKEYEKYLFYRGVGNFELPVKFSVDRSETLNITNSAAQPVPFIFTFEMINPLKVRYHASTKPLSAGTSTQVPVNKMESPSADWHKEVYKEMVAGLVGAGLYQDEARSMVETWWTSYFNKPGLRVFWVVPDADTDRILPLKVTPAPRKTVRVIVGRSEVMRPTFEQQLVRESEAEDQNLWKYRMSDRFGLAWKQRVDALKGTKQVKR